MLNRHRLSASAKSAPATWPAHNSRFGLVLSTVKYLLRTEVHTFAFSVAANAILSFFPSVLLLMTIIRRVFHSTVMYETVLQLLRDFLPAGQEFVIRNLNALVGAPHRAQIVSLVILLITSTGIFMPLEVALNRILKSPNNRSYLGNQLIALRLAGFLIMKIFAIAAIFFLIYWVLPNGKVPASSVVPSAVIMGLLSEILKYAYILALPRLDFQEVYGPFALSVSLMFWAFLSGLLLLTGAHLSAQRHVRI